MLSSESNVKRKFIAFSFISHQKRVTKNVVVHLLLSVDISVLLLGSQL